MHDSKEKQTIAKRKTYFTPRRACSLREGSQRPFHPQQRDVLPGILPEKKGVCKDLKPPQAVVLKASPGKGCSLMTCPGRARKNDHRGGVGVLRAREVVPRRRWADSLTRAIEIWNLLSFLRVYLAFASRTWEILRLLV